MRLSEAVQDLKTYEKTQETLAILELARQGDEDIAAGQVQSLTQAFRDIRKTIRERASKGRM